MRKLLYIFTLLLLLGCETKYAADPVVTVDEETVPEGKPRYVWIDAAANFPFFANDKAAIDKEMKKLADTGFTDIVVDVRPTEGTVLWKSKVAPEAKRLAAWYNGYGFIYREATWDYLQAFIDLGHAAGLRVHASMNTFVCGYGGMFGLESEGAIFSGDVPKSWAAMDNTESGIESSFFEDVEGTVFMNPASDQVQEYVLNIIKELAAYDLDGIILDRCRYDDTGLQSEYSDISKQKFTAFLGHEPASWPVFDYSLGESSLPSRLDEDQKAWLTFRVKIIHDFIQKAAEAVHGVNPSMKFGVYVGAWYSSYYPSGVNWASPGYNTARYYPAWAFEEYKDYGFADHCDYMFLGCYASTDSIYGTYEWSMQGFAKLGKNKLMGDTVCIGGPDIGNSEGWQNGKRSQDIPKTFDAIVTKADADGYFVFDLSHIRSFNYYDAYKKTFDNYLSTLTNN